MASGFLSAAMSAADSQSEFIAENWRLLRAFNIYRFLLALATVGLALSGEQVPPSGESAPRIFQVAGLIYAGIALTAAFTIQFRWLPFDTQTTFLAFAG